MDALALQAAIVSLVPAAHQPLAADLFLRLMLSIRETNRIKTMTIAERNAVIVATLRDAPRINGRIRPGVYADLVTQLNTTIATVRKVWNKHNKAQLAPQLRAVQ